MIVHDQRSSFVCVTAREVAEQTCSRDFWQMLPIETRIIKRTWPAFWSTKSVPARKRAISYQSSIVSKGDVSSCEESSQNPYHFVPIARDLKIGMPQNATCWKLGGGEVCQTLKNHRPPPKRHKKVRHQFDPGHMYVIDLMVPHICVLIATKGLSEYVWH